MSPQILPVLLISSGRLFQVEKKNQFQCPAIHCCVAKDNHTLCAMITLKLTFVRQFPRLFERRCDWLVVMWSAANVMVRPKAGQAKTLKSGWQTIRPIIVKLLTARLQSDRFWMDKKEMTDVELLLEHIRKASSNLANWPNTVQKSIVPAYSMRFKRTCFDIPGML